MLRETSGGSIVRNYEARHHKIQNQNLVELSHSKGSLPTMHNAVMTFMRSITTIIFPQNAWPISKTIVCAKTIEITFISLK